jgi:hypothetical protein
MKKQLLFIFFVVLTLSSYSQNETLIDENFQGWTRTESAGYPDGACETVTHRTDSTITYNLLTGGTATITLKQFAVSPTCNSKKVNQDPTLSNGIGVTTGFVSLNKVSATNVDTGFFMISKLPYVTSIEFAISATGANRGIHLYKSTDDGVTWIKVGGEFQDANSQFGALFTQTINENNVMLKFVGGLDNKVPPVSQIVRLHNIKIVGSSAVGVKKISKKNTITVSQKENGLLRIDGDVKNIRLINNSGVTLKTSKIKGSQNIDISSLAKGLYVVEVTDTNGNLTTQKIVK